MRGGPGTSDPGQISYTNVTLASVLMRAWDVKSYQVSGPDWLGSDRYDIVAKIPDGATREQFQAMLQKLVADRFHLVLHHETRDLQGYQLTVGRNGSRLKPAVEDDAAPQDLSTPPKIDPTGYPILTGPGIILMEGRKGNSVAVFVTAKAQPLSALIDLISREFRLPVLDKTGLGGKFDFQLEFAPQPPGALLAAPPDSVPVADDSAPNLIVAIPQQLGLRLLPRKIPLDILVVDRADRVPTEN